MSQPCSHITHPEHMQQPCRAGQGRAMLPPSKLPPQPCGLFPNQVILHPRRCLPELSCSHSSLGKANPAGLENLRLNLCSLSFEACTIFYLLLSAVGSKVCCHPCSSPEGRQAAQPGCVLEAVKSSSQFRVNHWHSQETKAKELVPLFGVSFQLCIQ